MSNYAEQLKRKIQLHKDTDFVDIATDDELISLANSNAEEVSRMNNRLYSYANKEVREEPESYNLLDQQIQEAFDEIHSHQNTNQVHLLEHLQQFILTGYKHSKEAVNY